MTKTESYAKHCVKGDENMGLENSLLSSYSARENSSQPNDLTQQSILNGRFIPRTMPTQYDTTSLSYSITNSLLMKAYGLTPIHYLSDQSELIKKTKVQTQMKLLSSQSTYAREVPSSVAVKLNEPSQSSTFQRNSSGLVDTPERSNGGSLNVQLSSQSTYAQEVPSSVAVTSNEPSQLSIFQRNSSDLVDTPERSNGDSLNVQLSSQSTYAREVPSSVAVKSNEHSQSSTSNSSDLLNTPDTSNEVSLNAHHLLSNSENDRKSSYDLLPVAEPLIASKEPQTIVFQEENNADLQHNQEITTSVEEALTVAESPCTTPDVSFQSVDGKTSGKMNQVILPPPSWANFDAYRKKVIALSNAHRSKSDTSGYEAQSRLLQPVKLSSDKTTTNNKLTSTFHRPKSQSDELNGLIPLTVTTPHSFGQPIQNDEDNFATLQLPVQNDATEALQHPIYIQTVPDAIQSATSGVKSSKIIIQSNQLVKASPVGSTVEIHPKNMVRILPNQIHLTSKAGKAVSIQMTPKSILKSSTNVAPNSTTATTTTLKRKLPTKIGSTSAPATTATLKRKLPTKIGSTSAPATTATLKRKRPTEIESTSVPATTTTLKRKIKENAFSVTPSKVQKLERPLQVTRPKIDVYSNLNLPEISIQRVATVNTAKGSQTAIVGVKSFSDYFKFLEKNNVTITRVPRKPRNETLEKYKKLFQENGVQISRVNPNH